MTYHELKELHEALESSYPDLPSFAAFKKAKKEGRIVASLGLESARATIVGPDEGSWHWNFSD